MNNIKGHKFKYLLGPARDSTPQGIPIQKPSITQPTKCCRQNLKYPDFHEKSSDFFESGMGQRCARQQNISANQLAASGLQAEDPPGPSFLFYMMFGVIQQLACKPSIQKGIWTTGKMVTGSLGPSNDYKLCSSFITVSAAPSVTNENPDGTADF